MDIHKPRPWHGVREFLKEYLIIVVGVLTALGAEAGVEAYRWQERTQQTEDHLRQKVHNVTVNIAGRRALQPCVDAMLDRLQSALETSGDGWRAPFVIRTRYQQAIVVAPKGSWGAEDWNAAVGDGTANHLPKRELLTYGRFFETVAAFKRTNEQETDDLAELNSLASVRRLDPASRTQYLRLLYRVRQDDEGMDHLSDIMLREAQLLNVKPGALSEYTPGAIRFYRRACADFRAGKTVIDLR